MRKLVKKYKKIEEMVIHAQGRKGKTLYTYLPTTRAINCLLYRNYTQQNIFLN